jgi:pilus assembly protein CpaE
VRTDSKLTVGEVLTPEPPTGDHGPEPELRLGRRLGVSMVDSDDTIRSVLVDHLRKLNVVAAGYEDLSPLIEAPDQAAPTVIVVGPSQEADVLLPEVQALLKRRPSCGAVMLVFDLTPEIVQRAFRAGVDDVVAVHAEDSELLAAIDRASEAIHKRLEEEELEQAAKAAAILPPVQQLASPVSGRVLTVFGTKGGVGKSVVATNLAAALATQASGPVALVDANLQFGDAAIMLHLSPEHTIVEAGLAAERLDPELLDDLLLHHEPTGLRVLAAPTEPGAADHIQRAELARILVVLREMCQYIVIDTSPHLDDATLVALEHADDIIMVAGLDVMSLKNSKVALQALQVLGVPFAKIKFVLNRTGGKSTLAPVDAERALRLKADAVLPIDELIEESVNKGVPLAVSAPEARFVKGIQGLVGVLQGAGAPGGRDTRRAGDGGGTPDPALGEGAGAPLVAEPKRRWLRGRSPETLPEPSTA